MSERWPLFFQWSVDQRLNPCCSILFPQQRSGLVGDPSILPGSHHSPRLPVGMVQIFQMNKKLVLIPLPSHPETCIWLSEYSVKGCENCLQSQTDSPTHYPPLTNFRRKWAWRKQKPHPEEAKAFQKHNQSSELWNHWLPQTTPPPPQHRTGPYVVRYRDPSPAQGTSWKWFLF